MYLGRVAGSLWATVKDPNLNAQRILIVQPLNPKLEASGRQVLCTDAVGAGAGELIYFTKGKEASFPFLPVEVPTDMTIVAIVDEVTNGERGGRKC
ncbi:MAG TPA: EutN/CcmL family microcompartment protein [Bryobacteraceae bacterium]|jgi:microcompartment protein CcmK/EutM